MVRRPPPVSRRAWLWATGWLALTGCGGEDSDGPTRVLSGQATRYARPDRAGIRVVVEPEGPDALTDENGGWIIADAPTGPATLRFEAPGFAAVRQAAAAGEVQPEVELFRGRQVELPPGLEVADVAELPPAGLLLTGGEGERVMVDLVAGRVGLTLDANWQPTASMDGFVVGVDAVTGEVSGTGMDGGSIAGPAGFTPAGALETGARRRGILLKRPLASGGAPDALVSKNANAPQSVLFWVPGEAPVVFPQPVLALGPPMRLESGDQAITLLVEDGWVRWRPGAPADRLAYLPVPAAQTCTPFLPPVSSAGETRTLCYIWDAEDGRTIDCVREGRPPWTLARLPPNAEADDDATLRPAQVLAEPPLLVWRDPAAGCTAALADGALTPSPFPCRPARVAARNWGDAAIFQDAAGHLHRLAPDAYADLGPGTSLTGGPHVLGYLQGGRWLTVLQPNGDTLSAAVPCSPGTRLHVAGDRVLALDAEAKQAVHLAADGRFGVQPLLTADLRAAEHPSQVSTEDALVGLAGANGFLRLDLDAGTSFSLVHRGWRFVDFSWPRDADRETTLPEIALARVRDRVRAVDLYTLHTEALGEGTHAGLLSGRAWFVGDRGLYVVDDPAAE